MKYNILLDTEMLDQFISVKLTCASVTTRAQSKQCFGLVQFPSAELGVTEGRQDGAQVCFGLHLLLWALERFEFALVKRGLWRGWGHGEGKEVRKEAFRSEGGQVVGIPWAAGSGRQSRMLHLWWILTPFPGSPGQFWTAHLCHCLRGSRFEQPHCICSSFPCSMTFFYSHLYYAH